LLQEQQGSLRPFLQEVGSLLADSREIISQSLTPTEFAPHLPLLTLPP
jgi:hypothetical protein